MEFSLKIKGRSNLMEKSLSGHNTPRWSMDFSLLKINCDSQMLNCASLEAAFSRVLFQADEMIEARCLDRPVDFPLKAMQP